mmetsp:Transcript_24247/g.67902  ORF Transcript_24247/g.67902 Transcript_24247/m.67902 type:complete len:368 (-) Transcript_24247:3154-4257(-)
MQHFQKRLVQGAVGGVRVQDDAASLAVQEDRRHGRTQIAVLAATERLAARNILAREERRRHRLQIARRRVGDAKPLDEVPRNEWSSVGVINILVQKCVNLVAHLVLVSLKLGELDEMHGVPEGVITNRDLPTEVTHAPHTTVYVDPLHNRLGVTGQSTQRDVQGHVQLAVGPVDGILLVGRVVIHVHREAADEQPGQRPREVLRRGVPQDVLIHHLRVAKTVIVDHITQAAVASIRQGRKSSRPVHREVVPRVIPDGGHGSVVVILVVNGNIKLMHQRDPSLRVNLRGYVTIRVGPEVHLLHDFAVTTVRVEDVLPIVVAVNGPGVAGGQLLRNETLRFFAALHISSIGNHLPRVAAVREGVDTDGV